MNLGVIQGRLSPPLEGFQDCPQKWRREFSLLSDSNLSHVEWIVTKNSFSTNPIFYENVEKFPIHSICADNLVDENIINYNFVFHNLLPICSAAVKNNIPFVTIPLLEKSNLKDDYKRELFLDIFIRILEKFPSLKFSLEAELPSEKLQPFLSISKKVFVTYDTGNITHCGYDHTEYILSVKDRISNVHLKDREFQGTSVSPGFGDTDFGVIFKALKKVNYDGVYTLQTARELPTKELETIQNHSFYLRKLHEQSI